MGKGSRNYIRLRKMDQRNRSRKGRVTLSYKQKEKRTNKNGMLKVSYAADRSSEKKMKNYC